MDKEQIIEFLKDNLSIEIDFNRWEYGGTNRLEVRLKIGDEVISKNSTYIDPTKERYE